jgi:hypothetical protein
MKNKENKNAPELVSDKRMKEPDYYQSLFQKAYGFNQKRAEQYQELTAFYELSQHELPMYMQDKPWVYDINSAYATDAINLRVASLYANDYLGEIEPLSPEDTDTVHKLNYAYSSMWYEMNMDKIVNDAILRAAVAREAYVHVIFKNKEYGGTNRKRKGKLEGYFIDPASLYLDPKALSAKESDFMIVAERMTPKQVKSKYPNFDFSDQENQKSSMRSPQERGEIYLGNDYQTEQDLVLTKLTFYEREDDGIYKTVLVENQIVSKTDKLEIDVFPIAQLRWQKRIKSPYGTSLMDVLLPLQKTINEIESAIANTALQFSNPSYVLSEESGIDPQDLALTAGTPGAVYVVQSGVDIDKVIRPLITDRKVDKELIEVKQELERTIYKLAGVTDQFLGDIGTPGNTKSGADLAVQRAKIIEQRFINNMEEFVEDLTEIIIQYLTHVFDGETLFIRGNKSTSGEFNFEQAQIPEDAKDLEYTFYIKLDVKTKYSKEQQRQLMMELYQIQSQYDTPVKGVSFIDVLRNYDVPNIQELVERFEHMTNMDAEQRAELITMLTQIAQEFQIDPQMLQQAIVEIVLALQETPTVDMILQQIEQMKAQQQQAMQTVEKGLMQNQIGQQQQMMEQMQQPTGDEVFNAEGGEPTGDEEITMG